MTQLQILKTMVDETDNFVLNTYLELAGSIITNRCYPFESDKPVPAKYYHKQIEIAAYLVNKRGAEGQTAHKENGIDRTYESAGVPESMLKDVVPFAGTFGGE